MITIVNARGVNDGIRNKKGKKKKERKKRSGHRFSARTTAELRGKTYTDAPTQPKCIKSLAVHMCCTLVQCTWVSAKTESMGVLDKVFFSNRGLTIVVASYSPPSFVSSALHLAASSSTTTSAPTLYACCKKIRVKEEQFVAAKPKQICEIIECLNNKFPVDLRVLHSAKSL